ncbi:hypothetical protein [Helicobacter sp.]|uniref:hypothetical protein n=1 Tax=Helicobacter sp. TaxID=218 RepID=UPI0025C2F374|nr:hypothetical protein [Helicobacter sp.]MCI5968180.1 hypothetical protein [Helicobacter sp.]
MNLKNYGIGSIVFIVLVLGWLYQNALKEIAHLKVALQIATKNTQALQSALDEQNAALKAMQVQATQRDTSAVDKIIIKDSSCEAELKGYKQLFKELGK